MARTERTEYLLVLVAYDDQTVVVVLDVIVERPQASTVNVRRVETFRLIVSQPAGNERPEVGEVGMAGRVRVELANHDDGHRVLMLERRTRAGRFRCWHHRQRLMIARR